MFCRMDLFGLDRQEVSRNIQGRRPGEVRVMELKLACMALR